MIDFWVPTTALVVLTVLILLAMLRGWRRRKERTAGVVGELPVPPTELGQQRTPALEGVYVGTTLAREWLERVAGRGLGERARGTAQLFDAGLVLVRQGTTDLYIPLDRIDAVRFDRGVAGKIGDPERLVVVTWLLEVPVDTGILLRHPEQARDLVAAIAAATGKEAG